MAALDAAARRGVVIELTEFHPRVAIAPPFRTVHGVDRPDGPSVDDLAEVIFEELGVRPNMERWERPTALWFEDWGEILACQPTIEGGGGLVGDESGHPPCLSEPRTRPGE